MLTGPAAASRKALKRARMKPGDIDLWEINEAFASVVLRFMRDLALVPDRVNVNGGAIALVTLCVGAGMGTATIIERV